MCVVIANLPQTAQFCKPHIHRVDSSFNTPFYRRPPANFLIVYQDAVPLFEECSDSELQCIYHDSEQTQFSNCLLEGDTHIRLGTFHTWRSNKAHFWWLQRLDIIRNQLLSIAHIRA